jgi:hypothetical protein
MRFRPLAIPVEALGVGNTGRCLDIETTKNLLHCTLDSRRLLAYNISYPTRV